MQKTVLLIGDSDEVYAAFERACTPNVKLMRVAGDRSAVDAALGGAAMREVAVAVIEADRPIHTELVCHLLQTVQRSVPVVALVHPTTAEAVRACGVHSVVLHDHPDRTLDESALEVVTYWVTHNVRPEAE